MFRYFLPAAFCIASFSLSAQSAGESLAGTTWILCDRDPSTAGQPRDALVFDAEGNGHVIRAQGNVAFRYQRHANVIALSPPGATQAVMLDIETSGERMQLRAPDGRPVASYARQGSAAMSRCVAR
ncbi:hypothetical protein ARC20_13800 [Stenotrophomonas panacihumi]|uniref:C-type lysozyme inhibitor domain-containing protein n=1 Tax=Stenotrophomonas panacihumi TaxID=676599 RepID=A0A0R0A2A9_9GAMM|nr:hypothetical protein [Stenotrophomonas panacihumi]KRG39356.1 hypothetical protein ARC20_13800 [Stenotrophomonas panacihumi]PTN54773.1 hypothetical protein C9J98_08745 [Stenotrophomonas panacihumi]